MANDADQVAYLYVLGVPGGPHKIGYSYKPEQRLRAMEREGHQGVFIAGKWPMGARIVQAAERYIHWHLRDRHYGKEWFNVTREEAEEAVRKAMAPEVVASFDPFSMIPAITTQDQKGLAHGQYMRSKFRAGTRERMQEVLHDGEFPADFIREAVEAELLRREAEAAKPDPPSSD